MQQNKFSKSNWDMLNKIAEEKYGEFGFSTLDENEMQQLIDINRANKIAEEKYGEFGFSTLDENEMQCIINDNLDLIIK